MSGSDIGSNAAPVYFIKSSARQFIIADGARLQFSSGFGPPLKQ